MRITAALEHLLSQLDPTMAIVVLTVINTVCGMLWYTAGRMCNLDRLVRKGKVDSEKLQRAQATVARYGAPAAFFAWLPALGTPLAVALGLMRAKALPTLLFMTAGKLARNTVLIAVLGGTARIFI